MHSFRRALALLPMLRAGLPGPRERPTRVVGSIPAVVLFMLSALSTTGCNSAMKTLDIKHNPHPKMRYEITLTFEHAPGPFESVTGYMQHQVLDKRCVPESFFEGARIMPDNPIDFAFARITDHKYVGTVYLDLLQDENYFGLGVCHWTMTLAGVSIKAQAASFETSISLENIVAQRPATAYLPKRAYFETVSESNVIKEPSGGTTRVDRSISAMAVGAPVAEYAANHPGEFFTVTLKSSEADQ